jgi:hypothetical protein
MCRGNPSLEYLNYFMGSKQDYHCRIAVLDFGSQDNTVITRVETTFNPSSRTRLRHFLDEFHQNCPHRRLFIVEDLTAEVIEALGCKFSIDPAFFAGHIRITEKSEDAAEDRSNVPRLPSLCNPHEQFHLKYWEVFSLNESTWGNYKNKVANGDKHYKIQNADKIRLPFNVFRKLWLEPSDKANDQNTDLNFGLSRCKASFWSRVHEGIDESSWDG